jgi:hypothetical protein
MKTRTAYVPRSLSQVGATLKLPVGTGAGDRAGEVEIRVIGDSSTTSTVIEALRAAANAGRIRMIPPRSIDSAPRSGGTVDASVGFLGFLDSDDHWVQVY